MMTEIFYDHLDRNLKSRFDLNPQFDLLHSCYWQSEMAYYYIDTDNLYHYKSHEPFGYDTYRGIVCVKSFDLDFAIGHFIVTVNKPQDMML